VLNCGQSLAGLAALDELEELLLLAPLAIAVEMLGLLVRTKLPHIAGWWEVY